jgi:hypothetical protein
MVTNLRTNQQMISGEDENLTTLLFRCWSFSVFDKIENRNYINEQVYRYLKQCFPNLTYDQ